MAITVIFLSNPAAPSADSYSPPDPLAVSQQPVPDHDPEAQLRGKSAMDHAEDLGAPVLMRRLMALQALIEMGPNALPARDTVRFVVEHGDSAQFSDVQIDELRLSALSAMHAMQAPEAIDLLRSKILDPDFATQDRSYAALLDAAMQVDIDNETLTRDLMSLIDAAPDHAERLMTLGALPSPVQAALDVAVFEGAHGEAATRYFLQRLDDLPFLNDTERLEYVLGNLEVAGPQQSREALARVGTEAALDAALAIEPLEGPARFQLISRFAEGSMSPEGATDRMLDEIRALEGEQPIRQGVSLLESALRDESSSIFARAMTELIESGPTTTHRAIGAARQVLFLQRNPDADASAALTSVFALLTDPAAAPEARIAAAKSLRQTPARLAALDPDYFIGEAVDLIWQADDPSEAELPVALLAPLMSSPELAPQVVDAIEVRFSEHLTNWAINPATAIAIGSGTTPGLERSATREAAAIMMGKAIQSTAIDLEYLGPHLARNGEALASLEANTVAGVIGTYAPTIFAEDKPASYDFALEPYMRPMLMRPGWFAQDPEAKAEWLAFLQRVIDLDDDNFSPTARRALERF
ncbi:hypothetical protein [Aquibaculum sediminis]|uniref:hypothetical protein n=1 Tax=Aquibaculum sediminis TaxID=3231907 RepID=UPI0034552230